MRSSFEWNKCLHSSRPVTGGIGVNITYLSTLPLCPFDYKLSLLGRVHVQQWFLGGAVQNSKRSWKISGYSSDNSFEFDAYVTNPCQYSVAACNCNFVTNLRAADIVSSLVNGQRFESFLSCVSHEPSFPEPSLPLPSGNEDSRGRRLENLLGTATDQTIERLWAQLSLWSLT